jgi:hypothetical protein
MRGAAVTTTPGVALHAGGTASAGELSQTAYVHFWSIQQQRIGELWWALFGPLWISEPAITKMFMHFSTTSPALFGRIGLLDQLDRLT